MGPLDALLHLANFFFVPALTGVLAAAAAKLAWRRDLAGVRWAALARDAALAGMLVAAAGLVAFGRDGRMLTYGAMVAACAFTLWWRGFARRR